MKECCPSNINEQARLPSGLATDQNSVARFQVLGKEYFLYIHTVQARGLKEQPFKTYVVYHSETKAL